MWPQSVAPNVSKSTKKGPTTTSASRSNQTSRSLSYQPRILAGLLLLSLTAQPTDSNTVRWIGGRGLSYLLPKSRAPKGLGGSYLSPCYDIALYTWCFVHPSLPYLTFGHPYGFLPVSFPWLTGQVVPIAGDVVSAQQYVQAFARLTGKQVR